MQQINLYQAQFKPKKVTLPPFHMLLILLGVILTLSVMSLYSSQRNSVLEKIISDQQQHTQQTIKQSTESPLLTAELEKINYQQFDKQRLLDYLSHQDFGNQRGFSVTLRHLSQQKIDNETFARNAIIRDIVAKS